jgi:formylmethanofuran dehydrogenase subunit D
LTEQEQEQEEIKIELEVEESPIEAEDGVVRIHEAVLQQLGAEEGHSIVTRTDEKSLLLTVYADKMIDKNLISIRPSDREKLAVSRGDKVTVSPHKTLGEAWTDKKEEIKEKLSETKEGLKEKLDIGQEDEEDKQ